MKNLVKMTRSAYSTARSNRTLVCPNVALITDENNKVEYLKQNPTTDIGIASWEGGVRKFYSSDEWNALETKPTALGVYVFTEDAQFIIHGTLGASSLVYGDATSVSGVTTADSATGAVLDYAGKNNSQAILDALSSGDISTAPIFTWANELSFADGTHPYVPAAGELELIMSNITDINYARTLLGQTNINQSASFWASTQRNATNAWYRSGGNWTSRAKTLSYYETVGVAIASL